MTHPAIGIRPVRKAYEQVADQLREAVAAGKLLPGDRLPPESALASQFGVSRATVREALRALAAQNLIRTGRGAAGGSFVSVPTITHVSDFLHANIGLLTGSDRVTLADLLEARDFLEVPSARLAAERRTAQELAQLDAAIPAELARLSSVEQYAFNRDFHWCLLEASHNPLLAISARPIYSVLHAHLAPISLGVEFQQAVWEQHHRILAAVQDGDATRAEQEMRDHLAFLRPAYMQTWRKSAADSMGG